MPVDKTGRFVIAMRQTSKTLSNLKAPRPNAQYNPHRVSVSWFAPSAEIAQEILLTRRPENPVCLELEGSDPRFPVSARVVLFARLLGMVRPTDVGGQPDDHDLVFFQAEEVVRGEAKLYEPLLHHSRKIFSAPVTFEVNGY